MSRNLPLVCLSLLFPVLLSCEQETVEPSLEVVTASEAKALHCTSYAYTTKNSGIEVLGSAWGELILVGFKPDMSITEKANLLEKFSYVKEIGDEFATDSGVITDVVLKEGTSCLDAEKLRKELEKFSEVIFTTPVFHDRPQDEGFYQWTGLTNEILVSIEGSGTLEQLEKLMKKTGTRIIVSYTDEIHVLSLDKNSSGNALDISTILNKSPYITEAVPNFIYKLLPVEQGIANRTTSALTTLSRRTSGFQQK